MTEPSNGDTSDTTVTANVLGTVIIPAGGRLVAQVVNTYTEDVSPAGPTGACLCTAATERIVPRR